MKRYACMLITALLLAACAAKSRTVAFRPPGDFYSYQNVLGLKVGAELFEDEKQAEEAFGFNIRAAGLLPMQLVLDNRTGQGVDIIAGQTFLVDENNRYWRVLSVKDAMARVQKYTVGKGAGKSISPSQLQRLAFKVVSGSAEGVAIVAEPAASDATGKSGQDQNGESTGGEEYRHQDLEGKVMFAETLASGIVYFPGEVPSPRELRLQVKYRGENRYKTINLKFK